MRIVHFSDWHGETHKLPHADLYVCTGDMLPNFPMVALGGIGMGGGHWVGRANMHLLEPAKKPPYGYLLGREVQPAEEEQLQKRWIREKLGSYRPLFANPDAPVVCIRGNHDFTDLSEAFGGDVWEVTLDPTRTTERFGLKVGGCRGIRYIVGEWSDEFDERGGGAQGDVVRPPSGDFDSVAGELPRDLDILLTHAPPNGILDNFGSHYGSNALRSYINERTYVDRGRPLRAHLFGHVHERHGSEKLGDTLFSNAARTHIVYDL